MCGVSLSVQWLTRAIVDDAQPPITHNRARLADEDGSTIVMRRRAASSSSSLSCPRGDPVFIGSRSNRAVLVVRSRQVRVAGIARTDRVRLGPGLAHCPRCRASLDIDHRGNPPRPTITRPLVAPARRPISFRSRHRLHAFRSPLLRRRARKKARTSCVPPDWDEATAPVRMVTP
jgi:hypothetical protein